MFWNKILPLAALLCCAALLLPGCRPSPALEQVIYTQKVYDLIVESGFAPTFEVPAAETAAE